MGLSLLTCLTFNACDDLLDKVPSDAFDDETALVDIVDFERELLNTYVRLRNGSYYGGQMLLLPDVMGDNLILCSDGRGTYQEMWRWKFTANTTSSLWAICYTGIKDANNVIVRLTPDNKFEGTEDSIRGRNVLAGAYAMRAFFHFDLVRTYGKTFSLASDADPGVPYKENTEVNTPARNTVKDVYTKIIGDLEAAERLMTNDYNSADNSVLRKKTLYGIFARIYLTMAGDGNTTYARKARDYSALAVKGDGSDVVPRANFAAIWTGTNKIDEVIWRIAVLDSDSELPGNYYGQKTDGNDYKNEYVATQSWLSAWPSTDIRGTSWRSDDSFQGRQYIGVKKYRSRAGTSTANKTDAVVMRASEIYLTIAEAEFYLGNHAQALDALDYVRSKRYSSFVSGAESGQDLLNAILLERRLELAFEGHRWFDLKRLAKGLARDDKGDKADGAGNPSPFTSKAGNDPYWALPIPYDEILANSNIKQNIY